MSTPQERAIEIIKERFNPPASIVYQVTDSDREFHAVEAFSQDTGARFPVYHWIVSCDTEQAWVADSKLPFIVNVALIQRGAGILL